MFWAVCIVAIVFGSITLICFLILHYIFRHRKNSSQEILNNEIKKLEELHQHSKNFKKRIENLETILMDKIKSGESGRRPNE
jgi:phage shock protein B